MNTKLPITLNSGDQANQTLTLRNGQCNQDTLQLRNPDSMELEEVKGYISNTIEILGKCLRTAFQGIRSEIDNISDLGERVQNGLSMTMDKVTEQETILDQHELMLKNIVSAARWMFDNQIKKNEQSDQAFGKLIKGYNYLDSCIEKFSNQLNQCSNTNNANEQKLSLLFKRDNDLGNMGDKRINIETLLKALSARFELFENRDLPKLKCNSESFPNEKSDIYSRLLVLEERLQKVDPIVWLTLMGQS